MSTVKQNLLANALGKGWAMLMSLAFVPLYIKFLGIEAYGLIGFYVTLQALFSILDMGLGATLNRELARCSAHPEQAQRMRDLVRTLETVYWSIAVLIGIVVVTLAPVIARYWLNAEQLSVSTLEQAILLMGFVMAFQWPAGFYSGGLQGLQCQVLNNVIVSGLATARGVGAVLVLWLISPSIEAYFQWQIAISIVGVTLTAFCLWQRLPAGDRSARFRLPVLRSVWGFALGMTGISVVTLFLMYTDKILLSALLPLSMFGYYTLASAVATASVFLATPIFTAMYPKFSQVVALDDQAALKRLYHQACQLVSVAVIPVVLTVSFFSYELLLLWTQDPVITQNAYLLASILALGSGLNALMHIPYALQLANGWTRLTFTANLIAVALLVPLVVVLVMQYGAIGAAAVWVVLNSGYVLCCIPIMHRRLLKGEMGRWYRTDIGRPLLAALVVLVAARWLMPQIGNTAVSLVYLLGAGTLAATAAALSLPQARNLVAKSIFRIRQTFPSRTMR